MKIYLTKKNQLRYWKVLVYLKIYHYFKKYKPRIILKDINEIRNYFHEEIEQNELISKKPKKVRTTLNYIEHFLILLQLLDVFQFLLVLTSMALIDSNITHDEFTLINNVLKEYDNMNKKI